MAAVPVPPPVPAPPAAAAGGGAIASSSSTSGGSAGCRERDRRRAAAAAAIRSELLAMSQARPDAIFDAELESRPAADRLGYLEERLRRTVAHAYAHAPRCRAAMDAAGVAARGVRALAHLARLPLTRK